MLLGLGNPLLDISAVVEEEILTKYGLKANDAILAEEKHMPLYTELAAKKDVEYIAGGATQNSMRVAQWVLGKDNMTSFFGCVGNDDFGRTLQKKATEAGVCVKYQINESQPTGTCAVVITKGGKCRSLVANLAAANHFTKDHIDIPDHKAILEKAKVIYISGFFLTVSPETILAVGKHAFENNKTFCMNLSAPFLCQFFKDPMMQAFPYIDVLFGNETEAATFSEVQGLGTTDVKEIALKISNLPKENKNRSRIVIITQGADAVICVVDGIVKEYPVEKLTDEQLIDTNGAGDAFVGGFLAELVNGLTTQEGIKCGIWAATQVIQRSGCTMPDNMAYTR